MQSLTYWQGLPQTQPSKLYRLYTCMYTCMYPIKPAKLTLVLVVSLMFAICFQPMKCNIELCMFYIMQTRFGTDQTMKCDGTGKKQHQTLFQKSREEGVFGVIAKLVSHIHVHTYIIKILLCIPTYPTEGKVPI